MNGDKQRFRELDTRAARKLAEVARQSATLEQDAYATGIPGMTIGRSDGMCPQPLPDISQLAFLLDLARNVQHLSPDMELTSHRQSESEQERARQALRVLGIEVNREGRK